MNLEKDHKASQVKTMTPQYFHNNQLFYFGEMKHNKELFRFPIASNNNKANEQKK